jgi:hypothetical protein
MYDHPEDLQGLVKQNAGLFSRAPVADLLRVQSLQGDSRKDRVEIRTQEEHLHVLKFYRAHLVRWRTTRKTPSEAASSPSETN